MNCLARKTSRVDLILNAKFVILMLMRFNAKIKDILKFAPFVYTDAFPFQYSAALKPSLFSDCGGILAEWPTGGHRAEKMPVLSGRASRSTETERMRLRPMPPRIG